jgi:putative ABC transport system permease protein
MFGHYLRTAFRNLWHRPFATLTNVLTLSLGLVCFVVAYAAVSYWQRSDSYFGNAARTYIITANMALGEEFHTGTMPLTNESYAKYLKADFPELEAVARAYGYPDVSASSGDRSLRLFRVLADPEFLAIFDLPFVAGDSRNALREPRSVVLTEETAQRLFGDEDPMGKTVTLANQIDTTVTGVIRAIPEPSHMGRSATALMPFDILGSWDVRVALRLVRNPNAPAELPDNWFGGYCCTTYVLLPEDGSLTAAELNQRLEEFPARHVPAEQLRGTTFEVGAIPLNQVMLSSLDNTLFGSANAYLSVTTVLLVLGGLILTVACINYANLATARAAGRAREIGLRKVVGAVRRQIVAQYMFEAALLAVGAGLVSVAWLGLVAPVLDAAVGIDLRPILWSPDRFWGFFILVIGIVTFVAGSYPALILSRFRPIEVLRAGRVRSGPRFVSTLLVCAQFVAASFLFIAVIVMWDQGAELRRTGLGTGADRLLVIDNASALTGVSSKTLREELVRLPEVKAVTASAGPPPWTRGVQLGQVSRSPTTALGAGRLSFVNPVDFDFFSVFGMKLLAGRVFDREHADDLAPRPSDPNPDRPTHIVVDRSFTEDLGFESPEAAVGQFVYGPSHDGEAGQRLQIIGVVEDRPLHFFGNGATTSFFMLFDGNFESEIAQISGTDLSGAVEAIDAMWKRLSPLMPRSHRFLDDIFNESYQTFGRVNQVFVVLAVAALFISLVGLVGMSIQVANRRLHEIGVRKTLGATTEQIVYMLLQDLGRPVLIANLIAWPLAYVAAKVYLNVFMHHIGITPLPFVLSLLITLSVAGVSVGGQAYRAARVQPARVLRSE